MKYIKFTILILLLFILKANASDYDFLTYKFILKNKMEKSSLVPIAEYYIDTNNKLTIFDILNNKNIKWTKSNTGNLNFGLNKYNYWFKIKTENANIEPIKWFLEIAYPHHDFIDLYETRNNEIISSKYSGDQTPFETRDLNYRNVIFRISQTSGINTYYVKISGYSSKFLTAFGWTEKELNESIQKESFFLGIYYGIMIIIVLYNLILFTSIKDKSYLYYVFWVISFAFFQFSVNGLGFQYLWSGSRYITNISNPFFLFLGSGFSYQFGKLFLNLTDSYPRFVKYINIIRNFMFILALLTFIVPYFIIIRVGVLSAILMSLLMLNLAIFSLIKGYKPARYYVAGWSSLLIGIIIFGFKTLGILPNNTFTVWSSQIGSAIEVILISVALSDRINSIYREKNNAISEINNELKKNNNELNEAYNKISLSEERYRMLAEGSDEIIFSLDNNFNIISINEYVSDILGIKVKNILNKNILDLVYQTENDDDIRKKIFIEKIRNFAHTGEPDCFKADFVSPIRSEPIELSIKLESLNINGKREIFGRAKSIKGDSLQKFFISESQKLVLDNYLMNIEEMTHRLTRNLYKYIDGKEITLLRLALREIIINSIEHGNLNISFQEKTDCLVNDTYFDLLAKRRNDPEYANRLIRIDYFVNPNKLYYKIEDEGHGFDYKKMLNADQENLNINNELHGRGLQLVKNIFDSVEFEGNGNKIILIKYIKKNESKEK